MAKSLCFSSTSVGSLNSASSGLFNTKSQVTSSVLHVNGSKALKNFQAVRCDLSNEHKGDFDISRRQAMIGIGSSSLAASFLFGEVLSEPAQAADLIQRIQRSEFQAIVKEKLQAAISENVELIPYILRLALSDALTYDKTTKTGGANGSIRFSEELDRPENKNLNKALEVLEKAKAEIDLDAKGGPISYADLIQFAGQAALKNTFYQAAIKKAGGNEQKGKQLYTAFGSSGQWAYFDKQFGRSDATTVDPDGRLPDWENLPVSEIKAKFESLGIKPRQWVVLTPFFGADVGAVEAKLSSDPELEPYVARYIRSKETVSQTDYEVDLITLYTKLSLLGAPINYEAYTYATPRPKFKF